MKQRRIRVGVVGVGSLGQWHARVYSEMPGAHLVGVYDADPERARVIAAQYKTRPYASLEELASRIEAASVVVPTTAHEAASRLLLHHNVHLLVEKPIAATTAEAERMVRMAAAHRCILQVGHVERFNPVLAFLESALTGPRFIEAVRLAPYPPPREGLPPRGTEVSVVLDLMIHDLEIILHLVRSPLRSMHAVGVPVLSPTEDIANVRLVFANGCVANVTASRISSERLRKIRVFQSDTYVSLDYQNQTGRMQRRTARGLESAEVPIEKGEPLASELASFVDCVRRRSQPIVTGEHAAEALKLAVRVCRQIRRGTP